MSISRKSAILLNVFKSITDLTLIWFGIVFQRSLLMAKKEQQLQRVFDFLSFNGC